MNIRIAAMAAISATAAALAIPTAPAAAQDYPSVSQCPSLIAAAEARRNIPRGLLMAIALTESSYNGVPNPYAMNIAGRAYHARSTQEMANVVAANQARGVRSIDVGCMQINLLYHGSRFQNPLQLLDSTTNVEYGASFLVALATQEGSWKSAVMSYHNKTNPARRQWYGCKVWNNYLRISGSQTGYLACGGAPAGSSTASFVRTAAPAGNPLLRYVSQPGPLTPPAYPTAAPAVIAGTAVDMGSRRRAQGSITIVREGQNIPDVVNDDARASAFNAIRPNDWSGRVHRATESDADVGTSPSAESGSYQEGFGRVASRPN